MSRTVGDGHEVRGQGKVKEREKNKRKDAVV